MHVINKANYPTIHTLKNGYMKATVAPVASHASLKYDMDIFMKYILFI